MTDRLPFFWIAARVDGAWKQRMGYLTAEFAERTARACRLRGHYEDYLVIYGTRPEAAARVRAMNEEAA